MSSKSMSLFLGFLLLSLNLSAQENADGTIRVQKTTDFEVGSDGMAREWSQTAWITLPKRQGRVGYGTTMKILYSDRGIYLLYQCEDKSITSTLKEDFADIFNEDVVEAFFWPEEKSVIYFEYELSPYNFELPILVPNYSGKFYGWRPWHYEGHRKTIHKATIHKNGEQVTGWSGEVFIPFDLLVPLQNVPPHSGTTWRANFYRIDYDDDPAEWAWKLTGPSFHEYEKFGKIVFE
jgi:hypothetical protein